MKYYTEWNKLDYIEMGRRIRCQREFSNLTREELADQLDLSPKFIADIEYGEKGMSIKNLYLLTQVLDVSADYILAGNKTMTGTDAEKECLKENLLGALDRCNVDQLQCLEQIVRFYVKAVKPDDPD